MVLRFFRCSLIYAPVFVFFFSPLLLVLCMLYELIFSNTLLTHCFFMPIVTLVWENNNNMVASFMILSNPCMIELVINLN